MPDTVPSPWCRCRHADTAHEHWRPGTNCGLCPCPRFVPAGDVPAMSPELRRALSVLLGIPALVLTCLAVAIFVSPGAAALLLVTGAVVGLLVLAPKKEDP